MVWTGLWVGVLMRVGVESGWYVPGWGRVGFPVAGQEVELDGVDQVMVASGVRLRAGVKLGRCGILAVGRVVVWQWLA